MMPMYGYARVSTQSQSTDLQVSRLRAAGCDVVRYEAISVECPHLVVHVRC